MLVLNHDSQVPLYRQLYEQISKMILSAKLPSDSKLPSVRDLSAQLSVSRNTVETAYQELYAEGYIYSTVRSGYFVSALTHDLVPLKSSPQKVVLEAVPEGRPSWDYDFHPARLDQETFPAQAWRRCFLESMRETARRMNEYSGPQGEWALRRQIQKYLEESRGVVCETEQIVITAGLQHSVETVAHLLTGRDPVAAVEDPGFHLTRSVLRNNSFRVVPVPVGASGMDLDALQATGCTVAYVTPSHQFPMGSVMPVANRLKLIQWSQLSGGVIIEDDYDSELRYHGKPIPSLQGLAPQADVVYSGTFSKVLSPALRVSYLVLPRSLLPVYRGLFKDYAPSVSLLEQRTLALFMEEGHWERHVRRMRALYKRKHDALIKAVDRHFGDRARVMGAGAGLHVVLQLSTSATEEELACSARENGIGLFPLSVTAVNAKPDLPSFFLGFGGLTLEAIDQGVELLYRSWFRC